MDIKKVCRRFCIGCGLCKSELGMEMKFNEKGFLVVNPDSGVEVERFLERVCPVNERGEHVREKYVPWGPSRGVYAAHACDNQIRTKGSSGGVLSALAIYLLEKRYVDGIVHVVADEKNPTGTKCKISTTKEEIIEGCGSRYSISSPWVDLSKLVQDSKKYAAIGKPCDIKALRNLKDSYKVYGNIVYLLSFFCAGMPSKQANDKLLNELGCVKGQCKKLTYRGNGWPGYATAIDENGKKYTMEYGKAWGEILGRDVHPYCRLCIDGIGEAADISCGDGWYITENNTPDFTEHEGRNVVFVRTELGKRLFDSAVAESIIESTEWENQEKLKIIQKYQYTRRTTMREKIVAYKIFGKVTPMYVKRKMRDLSRYSSTKERVRIFAGTVKRIVQKKI